MATAEKNVCNLLRDTWYSLILLLENLSDVPRKILTQIKQLVQKLKNIVDDVLVNYAREISELIKSYLGLRKVDPSKARKNFCSLLYACLPAVNKMIELGVIPKELSDFIFKSGDIDEKTLEKFGIFNVTINNNFDLFEYVACRLSTTTLLNSYIDNMINSLLQYLQQFEKFLDVDYWLNNHYIGRLIKRKIAEYEALMATLLDIINNDLEPFMDCVFASCDFSISTKNFMDDFSSKTELISTRKNLTSLSSTWSVSKDKILSSLTTTLNETKDIFVELKTDAETTKDNFDNTKSELTKNRENSDIEPQSKNETVVTINNTPKNYNRQPIILYTQTSEVV